MSVHPSEHPSVPGVVDGSLDLLLGGTCVGCGRAGRLLCRGCRALLPTGGRPAWPDPVPPGLVPPWAAAEYDGVVRAMVLGHKEHRLLALRPPLGALLAGAVVAASPPGRTGALVLVPVPSRPGSARSRGHDPTLALTRDAARRVHATGRDVFALPMLRSHRGVADQAGLDAAARAANLAGSMSCPGGSLRRLAALRERARVVVCDDVLTTGATAREAQRALEAVGLEVVAIAAVAATRRRVAPRPDGPSHASDR